MIDEKLLWDGKPELSAYWLPLGLAGLFALAALATGGIPALVLPAGIFGCVWLIRNQYYFRVTDKRIICKSGIIARRTSEIDIADIRSIDVTQSIMQRALGLGNLEFSSAAGPFKEAILLDVKQPEALKEMIRRNKAS